MGRARDNYCGGELMQVTLLSHTFQPEYVVAKAAWDCTHTEQMPKDYDYQKMIRNLLALGHYSVLEFAVFSFRISGVSRACTAQLTRHRIASYAQQSQRYNKYVEGLEVVVPDSVGKFKERFTTLALQTQEFYKELLDNGVPAEDARYILPIGAESVINIQMNARTLREFFAKRRCLKTQWELRLIADHMFMIASSVAPNIFSGKIIPCGEKKECKGCARNVSKTNDTTTSS